MDSSLKQRLVGAIVLVALAVIFLPMLVKGPAPDSGVSDVSMEIPKEPGDAGTTTVDLPLGPAAALPQGGVVGMPDAAQQDDPATAPGIGASPGTAAGDYVVSFGSYATAADARQVIAALRKAGLPAYFEATRVNGRDAQRVRIGPFADRAVAESARIAAARINGSVDAKVVVLDAGPDAPSPVQLAAAPSPAPPVSVKPAALPAAPKPDAPPPAVAVAKPAAAKPSPVAPPPAATPVAVAVAKPAAETGKTGFAVQVGAFSAATDATALRDKLRGAGFNAFTDTVSTSKGVLTRVRVGPAMNRAEADALKASVKAKVGLDGMVRPHP